MSSQQQFNTHNHTPVVGRHHSEHGAHEVKGHVLDTADGKVTITRRQLTKAGYRNGKVTTPDGETIVTKSRSQFQDCQAGRVDICRAIKPTESKKRSKRDS